MEVDARESERIGIEHLGDDGPGGGPRHCPAVAVDPRAAMRRRVTARGVAFRTTIGTTPWTGAPDAATATVPGGTVSRAGSTLPAIEPVDAAAAPGAVDNAASAPSTSIVVRHVRRRVVTRALLPSSTSTHETACDNGGGASGEFSTNPHLVPKSYG